MIAWKLKDFLRTTQNADGKPVTPYQVARVSGLSQTTVYRIVNKTSDSITFITLDRILEAITKLTGKPVLVSDVLEYQSPKKKGKKP